MPEALKDEFISRRGFRALGMSFRSAYSYEQLAADRCGTERYYNRFDTIRVRIAGCLTRAGGGVFRPGFQIRRGPDRIGVFGECGIAAGVAQRAGTGDERDGNGIH
jgi:hypothetical protein